METKSNEQHKEPFEPLPVVKFKKIVTYLNKRLKKDGAPGLDYLLGTRDGALLLSFMRDSPEDIPSHVAEYLVNMLDDPFPAQNSKYGPPSNPMGLAYYETNEDDETDENEDEQTKIKRLIEKLHSDPWSFHVPLSEYVGNMLNDPGPPQIPTPETEYDYKTKIEMKKRKAYLDLQALFGEIITYVKIIAQEPLVKENNKLRKKIAILEQAGTPVDVTAKVLAVIAFLTDTNEDEGSYLELSKEYDPTTIDKKKHKDRAKAAFKLSGSIPNGWYGDDIDSQPFGRPLPASTTGKINALQNGVKDPYETALRLVRGKPKANEGKEDEISKRIGKINKEVLWLKKGDK